MAQWQTCLLSRQVGEGGLERGVGGGRGIRDLLGQHFGRAGQLCGQRARGSQQMFGHLRQRLAAKTGQRRGFAPALASLRVDQLQQESDPFDHALRTEP